MAVARHRCARRRPRDGRRELGGGMNCPECGSPVVRRAKTGPMPTYCGQACRRAVMIRRSCEWQKANRDRHLEFQRSWLRDHATEARAATRRWEQAHPEMVVARARRFYESQPDKRRGYMRTYLRARPEQVAEHNARRRRAGIFVAPIDFAAVFAKTEGRCHLCRQPVDLTVPWPNALSRSIDHLTPISKGGTHEPANVALAHLGCNMKRGVKPC